MSTPLERAQRTVDATFRDQGVAASYTPPGGFVFQLCTAIHNAPDADGIGGHRQALLEGNIIELRRSEIASPVRNGTVEMEDGPTFTIQDDPHFAADDVFRLVWLMTVA